MLNNYKEKVDFFKEVINDIQIGIRSCNLMNIISSNEYNKCLDGLDKTNSIYIIIY